MSKRKKVDLGFLEKRWPSPLVARTEFHKFTGGTVGNRTIANLDNIGEGPANRMRIGRKVVYPVIDVIKWLESRAEVLD